MLNVREELVDIFICSLCLEYYTRSGSVITVFWCTHILVYVLCQLDWDPFLIMIILLV